jgi:hypothetical protein
MSGRRQASSCLEKRRGRRGEEMRITDEHRQLAARVRQLADLAQRDLSVEISGPEWGQDRDGEFMVLHVNGTRVVIEVPGAQIADLLTDPLERHCFEHLVRLRLTNAVMAMRSPFVGAAVGLPVGGGGARIGS